VGAAEVKEGLLFVNKKKQKNFSFIGHGAAAAPWPTDEVFCALFFKKAPLPSLCVELDDIPQRHT
jgi:hypothetical protein